MTPRRIAVLLVALLLVAACGSTAEDTADGDDAAGSADAPTQEAADAGDATEPGDVADDGAVTLTVADSDLGDIVTDGDGVVLYVFDDDEDGTSTCAGDCAANWPPVPGDVTAGDGIDEALLGTTEREDGSTQVTYDGSPLYYYAGDQEPGDTNGQGVGDVWWVVGPDGERITDVSSTADDGGGY